MVMNKILITVLLFSAISSYSQTDQDISGTTARETEPFIAVNPTNPNNIIVAWMSISYPSKIVTKCSYDGGDTWGNINYLPHFSNSILITSADESIAFNNSGTAFISYVDYKITIDSGFVRVAKSTDGGMSWSNPVNAIDGLSQPDKPIDRPWIACDKSNSAYSGRIYLVSKSYYAASPPQKIWLSVSTDDANTFSPVARLDTPVTTGSLTNIMGVPAVGQDGTFYSGYLSWDLSQSLFMRVICTKSTDGGNTFTQSTIAYPVSGSGISDTLYKGDYTLDVNPQNPDNLVFTVTDARNGDPDILAVYSMDGGQTWTSTPIRVNDDSINNGIGQDMVWSAFSPNGTYAVAWRDRRNGITNDTSSFEIYTSVSLDGGASFYPNYCLSSEQSPFINIQNGNDFIGVALSDAYLFVVWSDNRNNNPDKEDIYIDKKSIALLTSINNINYQSSLFNIFPNPTTGIIHINSSNQPVTKVSIFNLYGKLINEYHTSNFSASALPSGIYYIKIETNTASFTKKLIVIK